MVGTAVLAFLHIYQKGRSQERERVDATPTIATQAVAAGLIDKTSADTIVRMADDVHKILDVAERWEDAQRERAAYERGRAEAEARRSSGQS